MVITSSTNPKVKQARALKSRKEREKTGLCIVEGIHPVGEAVSAWQEQIPCVSLEYILYAPDRLTSHFALSMVVEQAARGVTCLAVAEEVFTSLADRENPQGILAVVRYRSTRLEELTPEHFSWGVGLVSSQDPGNVGTVLRTIDAVGASGLLLLDDSVDLTHPSVVRASMGTLFWYPVVLTSFSEFTGWAKQRGYTIYGTSAHAETSYQEVQVYNRPLVLLMGSERQGLSTKQATACHQLIRLPMRGRASSLNLGVAAGIFLYDMIEKIR